VRDIINFPVWCIIYYRVLLVQFFLVRCSLNYTIRISLKTSNARLHAMPIYCVVACEFTVAFSHYYNTLYYSHSTRDQRLTDSGACVWWVVSLYYVFGVAHGQSKWKWGLRLFSVKVTVICFLYNNMHIKMLSWNLKKMLRFVWLVFFSDNVKIMRFSQNSNKNSFRILYHCNVCTNRYHDFLRFS